MCPTARAAIVLSGGPVPYKVPTSTKVDLAASVICLRTDDTSIVQQNLSFVNRFTLKSQGKCIYNLGRLKLSF